MPSVSRSPLLLPLMIELCAGENSRLCRPSEQAKGCYTVRITAEDDLTSATGRQKVLDVISKYRDTPILIWVSIPCTGGSTWQRRNRKKSQKAAMSIQQHILLFTTLLDSLLLIASHCGSNVCFAIEWLGRDIATIGSIVRSLPLPSITSYKLPGLTAACTVWLLQQENSLGFQLRNHGE